MLVMEHLQKCPVEIYTLVKYKQMYFFKRKYSVVRIAKDDETC